MIAYNTLPVAELRGVAPPAGQTGGAGLPFDVAPRRLHARRDLTMVWYGVKAGRRGGDLVGNGSLKGLATPK